MPIPTKKPTPSEYGVLAVVAAAGFIVLGIVALVVAWQAPDEKQELAAMLQTRGWVCLGIGAGIAGVFWLVRRLGA